MVDQGSVERARVVVVERLRVLEEEAAALRGQLRALDTALELARRLEGLRPDEPIPADTTGRGPARRRPQNPPREEVIKIVLRALDKARAPVPRSELLAAVREAGFAIYGKDPEVVFSTMLWREREKVVRLGKLGYWPADKPYPPASYAPNSRDVRRR